MRRLLYKLYLRCFIR